MSPSPHLHQHTDVYFSDLTQSPGWQPALGLLYMINYVIANPHWPPLHLFLSPLPLHSHLFSLLLNKSSSQISPSCVPPCLSPSCWLSAHGWGSECPATLCDPQGWGTDGLRWDCGSRVGAAERGDWSEPEWVERPQEKPHNRSVCLCVEPRALVRTPLPWVSMQCPAEPIIIEHALKHDHTCRLTYCVSVQQLTGRRKGSAASQL